MFSGTFVSRLLGFVKSAILVIALTSYGGASVAFTTANTLPNTIYMLLAGGVINAVLVPQLVRAAKDKDGGQNYANRLLTVAGVGLLLVTVLLTAAAPLLVRLFGSGLGEWLPVAYAFAFWCIPQVFFYGMYTLVGQVLNARSNFGPYMWAPALNNVVAIAGLGVYLAIFGGMANGELTVEEFGSDRIMFLGIITTLGVVAQALILFIPLHRSGFRYRPAWGLQGLGGASRMAMWTFAGLGVGQIGFIAVSNVSNAARGAVAHGEVVAGSTMYGLAFTVFMLPQSLIVVSLITALFTRVSAKAAAKDGAGVRSDLSLGLRTVGVFTVLAGAVLAVLAIPVARTIQLGVGGFAAAEALGAVIVGLVVGLPALGFWTVVQRVYYAYEDAKSLFYIQIPMALIVAGGSVLGYFLLPPTWWVVAATASMTLSTAMGALVGYLGLRRRMPSLDGSRVLLTYLRLTMAVAPAVLLGFGAMHFWGADQNLVMSIIQVAVIGTVMSVVYVMIARKIRVTELEVLTSRLGTVLRPITSRVRTMAVLRRGGPQPVTATGERHVLPTDAVETGTLLASRFRVGEFLESSTPGIRVWRGRDTILERSIDVLSVAGAQGEQILDAARRAALVTDPRLPRVLRVGEQDGTGYVVLEPFGAVPLEQVLTSGPLPAEVARSLAGELAGALEAGRRRGVHHLAVSAATVGVTPDGAVRLAGLGTEAAARGTEISDAEAAHADAAAVVALFTQLVTTPDGVPSDAQDILDSLPHEVRATSNLVVGLTPWAPVPPVAALVAGGLVPPTAIASVATPGVESVESADGAAAPESATVLEAQALEAEGLADAAGEDEVLAAVEEELVAQTGAGYGSPGWIPVITPDMDPPSFDDVMTPGASAAATLAGEAATAESEAEATSTAAEAGTDVDAADSTESPDSGAAAGSDGSPSDGSTPSENPVKGWLRRLDAVIPSAPMVAATAPASESSDPSAPALPARVIDTSSWTVLTPAALTAAPSTVEAVLEATSDPAPGSPVRHDSAAGVGAMAAAFSGLIAGVTSRLTRPTTPAATRVVPAGAPKAAETASTAPETQLIAPVAEPIAPSTADTHTIEPAELDEAPLTQLLDEATIATPARGIAAPPTIEPASPQTPAWNSIRQPSVTAQVPSTQARSPQAPSVQAPQAPPRQQAPARDEDYVAPRRKPRGSFNATPFVLLIVLGGVGWVLYLAVSSLIAAARFGGSDDPSEPATGAPATSELSPAEGSRDAAQADAAQADAETEPDAVDISPADLPHELLQF